MNDSVNDLLQNASAYLESGQPPAARAVLDSLIARDPKLVQAHLMLGGIAWRENRRRDAIRHALDAARVVPDDGPLLVAVVAALIQVGECVIAMECLKRPVFADTSDGDLLMQAAAHHQLLEDHPAALELYERAHAAGVDGFEYRFNHATQLSFHGRLREAEEELERCVGMEVPRGNVYVNLARLRQQTPEHNHLRSLDRMLEVVQPGSEDLAGLEFARYKELEDLGRYDEAWTALAHGNAVMAARMRYDAPQRERLLGRLRELCTGDFVRPVQVEHDGAIPIFVIGMTRSGTTVLDRVLGNHSQVQSAGEIKDFGAQLNHVAGQCSLRLLDGRILERLPHVDYAKVGARYLAQTQWRANGRQFYVDKFPPNWQLAGLIRRAIPQARILHLVRDPMDVCFSNFRAFFGQSYAWSYDLDHLAHFYQQYRRTMAHWHAVMPGQILDVDYADLARDPEATARKVFAFCGLAYEAGTIDLSRNKAAVASRSMVQVRDGIHARAFEEWLPYASHLAGLRAAVAG